MPAAMPACATTAPTPSVAAWIIRLAKKVSLTGPRFTAAIQTGAGEIAALSPTGANDKPAADETEPSRVTPAGQDEPPTRPPITIAPQPAEDDVIDQPPAQQSQTADAERQRVYREILGLEEPKPRRRWRR